MIIYSLKITPLLFLVGVDRKEPMVPSAFALSVAT
jgi:hypothetical protein